MHEGMRGELAAACSAVVQRLAACVDAWTLALPLGSGLAEHAPQLLPPGCLAALQQLCVEYAAGGAGDAAWWAPGLRSLLHAAPGITTLTMDMVCHTHTPCPDELMSCWPRCCPYARHARCTRCGLTACGRQASCSARRRRWWFRSGWCRRWWGRARMTAWAAPRCAACCCVARRMGRRARPMPPLRRKDCMCTRRALVGSHAAQDDMLPRTCWP